MQLFLIRHGQAVEEAPGLGDSGRWLTQRGRKVTRRVGRSMARSKSAIQLTRNSDEPAGSGRSVCRDLAAEVGYRGEIRACEELSSGSDPADVLKLLAAYGGDGPLAVIGHEPVLSLVATSLLGDGASAAWSRSEPSKLKKSPVFKKSAVMGIALDDGKGELKFVLDPKDLRVR